MIRGRLAVAKMALDPFAMLTKPKLPVADPNPPDCGPENTGWLKASKKLGAEVHRSGFRDPCALRDGQIPVCWKGPRNVLPPERSYGRAGGCGIGKELTGLAGIGDLAGDSHILVIQRSCRRRESVQIKERTEATLDTPGRDGRHQRCTRRKGRKIGAVNAIEVLKRKS